MKRSKPKVAFGTADYKYASDMIKEAMNKGYKHIGGPSTVCKGCEGVTARKFTRDNKTVYCCHKCKAYWYA